MKKKGLITIAILFLSLLLPVVARAEELPVIVVPRTLEYQHRLPAGFKAVEAGGNIFVENEKGVRILFSACEAYLKDGKKGLDQAFINYLEEGTSSKYPKPAKTTAKPEPAQPVNKEQETEVWAEPTEDVAEDQNPKTREEIEEENLKTLFLDQQQVLSDIATLQAQETVTDEPDSMQQLNELSMEYNILEMQIAQAAKTYEEVINPAPQVPDISSLTVAVPVLEEVAEYDEVPGDGSYADIAEPEVVEATPVPTLGLELGVAAPGYIYSAEEIKILAQVMRHEAGNQCTEGQIAVVEVILNRMFSPYFPNTVSEVVYAPHQFSYVERSKKIVPTEDELNLVKSVVTGQARVLNDPRILYYKNQYICDGIKSSTPKNWGRLQWVTYIQDHAFYIDPKKG